MMIACDSADYEVELECSGPRSATTFRHGLEGDVEERAGGRRFALGVQEAPVPSFVSPSVALVDDEEDLHCFLRELEGSGHFRLTGSFYTGATALDHLPEQRPDAVIMDIRLPDLSGIDCAGKLKTVLPGLPIIMVTGYPDGRTFFRSLFAGAKGFLVKPVSPQEFLTAIDEVVNGDFALAKQVVPFLVQLVRQVGQVTQGHRLSRREEEILACLFEGMQDKEIASALGIGTATVHTHMHRLFEKLGVPSRRNIIAKFLALT